MLYVDLPGMEHPEITVLDQLMGSVEQSGARHPLAQTAVAGRGGWGPRDHAWL